MCCSAQLELGVWFDVGVVSLNKVVRASLDGSFDKLLRECFRGGKGKGCS